MSHHWWNDVVQGVEFFDTLWGLSATVSDDPEVGITVEVSAPNLPHGIKVTLGEQDILDILAVMVQIHHGRAQARPQSDEGW